MSNSFRSHQNGYNGGSRMRLDGNDEERLMALTISSC